MTVGLGSGSTAEWFVRAVGLRVAAGLQVRGVPTSVRTAEVARGAGIELVDLDGPLDLAVDGADAVARGSLDAIKGLGGALAREKLVALAARRFVIVGDSGKIVERLSDRLAVVPVPVEVLAFGWQMTRRRLEALGRPVLRERDGAAAITDNGNLILDLYDAALDDAPALALTLSSVPGVVEHGLFIGIVDLAILAGPDGLEELRRA
jgi:ribose 5-phosphate isomerase A